MIFLGYIKSSKNAIGVIGVNAIQKNCYKEYINYCMVTSLPSTTELENQAKVKKSLVSKKFVLQNCFPSPSSNICRTCKLPYLNIPISKLTSREVPKLCPTKYIHGYLSEFGNNF